MAGYYYFLPQLTQRQLVQTNKLNRELLEGRGLGDVLADCQLWPRDITVSEGLGPNGSNGVILYVPPISGVGDAALQYDAKRQTWQPVDDGSDRWIGWVTDDPPTPAELLRKGDRVTGRYVIDEAGREWLIPVARATDNPCGYLPQNFRYDAAGKSTSQVKPQHQWLWDVAGEVWDCFNWRNWRSTLDAGEEPECERPADLPDTDPPPGETHDEQWLRKVALDVLGVNYRVGYAEINALADAGLPVLDEMRVQLITMCLIDLQFIRAVQKKTTAASTPTAPSTCDSSPGDTEDCPATDPLTANCA